MSAGPDDALFEGASDRQTREGAVADAMFRCIVAVGAHYKLDITGATAIIVRSLARELGKRDQGAARLLYKGLLDEVNGEPGAERALDDAILAVFRADRGSV